MTHDPTESTRRAMLISGQPQQDLAGSRAAGQVEWTTDELREQFEVLGFMAPFVAVRRKSDGCKGSLEFTHNPRYYFNWVPD